MHPALELEDSRLTLDINSRVYPFNASQKRCTSVWPPSWPTPAWTRSAFRKNRLIKSASRSARVSLVRRRADSRTQICAACPGVGVLSDRSQRLAGVTANASRLFRRANYAQAQAGGCAGENQESCPAGIGACRALRNCNRELRLKREIPHENCCPLLTKLDRMNGSSNRYVSSGRESGKK
jgi:hypothetical protein